MKLVTCTPCGGRSLTGTVVFSRNDALTAGRTIAGATTGGLGRAQELLILLVQRGGRVRFGFERSIALSDQGWAVVIKTGGIRQGRSGKSVSQPVEPEAGARILDLTTCIERSVSAGNFPGAGRRAQPRIARAG